MEPTSIKQSGTRVARRESVTLVEKLATYGLRRAMTIDDRRLLTVPVSQVKTTDYRLRDMVEALVVSDLFQLR